MEKSYRINSCNRVGKIFGRTCEKESKYRGWKVVKEKFRRTEAENFIA
jgi:hypothetical protein